MDQVEQAPFEPMSSPEVGVFDFVVRIPKSAVKGGVRLVPGVTTYKTFPFAQRARCNEGWAQNYVFVFDQDGAVGWHEFYFTLNRLGSALTTPVASLSLPAAPQPHLWPDVMLRMGFIEDASTPLTYEVSGAIVNVPRLFLRYWKLPGGVIASMMRVETFLSPRPFPRSMFQLDVPVATTVTWDMRNLSGSFTGLHPEVRFAETQTEGRVLQDAGTVGQPITIQGYQIFPATNHPQWQQHVCDEVPSQERGVYKLVRTTVEPPAVQQIENSA